MKEVERRGGAKAAAVEEDKERLLEEDVTVLDFDMLCATVAMQAQKGKWGKLNEESEEENFVSDSHEYGGGVHRMWEGELVYDFFDDRRLTLQSTCCPCYRFGKNVKRAGFGSCFLQGSFYLILIIIALGNLIAFTITRRCYFLYLAISFALSVGGYLGYYRIQIKKKFNIKLAYAGWGQFFRRLSLPSYLPLLLSIPGVEDTGDEQCSRWHLARQRRYHMYTQLPSEDSKSYLDSSSPFFVSTKSPELLSMQKPSNDSGPLSSSLDSASPLIPPPG